MFYYLVEEVPCRHHHKHITPNTIEKKSKSSAENILDPSREFN